MRKGESFERIKLSDDEYEQLKSAERKTDSVKIMRRIQAFKFMYIGWKYTAIADFLLVTENTITNWINLYKKGGINLLLTLQYKGGQARLDEEQLSELRDEASKSSFIFAKDVQHYIKQNFGVEYNLSHVQLLSKKNFSYPLKKRD